MDKPETRWSRGLRWNPHPHAPGTLPNAPFGNDWEGYIRCIEAARPTPVGLGVTDYFTLRGCEAVIRRRQAGALHDVAPIFPNVELRVTIDTKDRQGGINLHLLLSLDDCDHVVRFEQRLAQLRFRFRDDSLLCADGDLCRLSRAHRRDSFFANEAAMREGANHFKVELSDVRTLIAGAMMSVDEQNTTHSAWKPGATNHEADA